MDGERELTYDEVYDKLMIALDALRFYADPGTYFAIAYMPDPPCGDFINDFEETISMGYKPGKIARKAIQDILEEEITPEEFIDI